MARKAGDTDATRLLVEAYRAHVEELWKVVARLGVDERDASDVTHDVFVVAQRRWAEFDTSRPIRPWLLGITCRVVADWRQSARVRREVLEEPDTERVDQQGDAFEQLSEAEERASSHRLVLAALDELPPERREVFVLYELEELSMPELSALLEVPLNTLYSRLRIARTEFKKSARRLKPRGDES